MKRVVLAVVVKGSSKLDALLLRELKSSQVERQSAAIKNIALLGKDGVPYLPYLEIVSEDSGYRGHRGTATGLAASHAIKAMALIISFPEVRNTEAQGRVFKCFVDRLSNHSERIFRNALYALRDLRVIHALTPAQEKILKDMGEEAGYSAMERARTTRQVLAESKEAYPLKNKRTLSALSALSLKRAEFPSMHTFDEISVDEAMHHLRYMANFGCLPLASLRGRAVDFGPGVNASGAGCLFRLGADVTSVEIDKSSASAARSLGMLSKERIVNGDGIAYLLQRPNQLDLVSAFMLGPVDSKNPMVMRFLHASAVALKERGRLLVTSDEDTLWCARMMAEEKTLHFHLEGFSAEAFVATRKPGKIEVVQEALTSLPIYQQISSWLTGREG